MDILSLVVGALIGGLLGVVGILLTKADCQRKMSEIEAEHRAALSDYAAVIGSVSKENENIRTTNADLMDQKLKAWSIPDRI
jgi:hypothetical protein